MKKYISKFLILSVLALTHSLIASTNAKLFQGQTAHPTFNLKGDLICVYKDSEKRISLDTMKFQGEGSITKTVSLGTRAFSPIIKKDRQGQIWIVWAERVNSQSLILFGRLEGSQIVSSQVVSRKE